MTEFGYHYSLFGDDAKADTRVDEMGCMKKSVKE